jgi:TolB protein
VFICLISVAPLGCSDESPTSPGGGDDDPPVPAKIALSSESVGFTALADSLRLDATVEDAKGRVIADAAISWSSTDTAVAKVNASGWVRAVAPGEALVVARAGEVADSAAVVVAQAGAGVVATPDSISFTALGDSAQVSVVLRDANGHAIPGAEPAWSSTDTAVVTVNAAGWVLARGNGAARVVATAGESADTVVVRVEQVAAGLELSRDSVRLAEGGEVRLEALVVDGNGAPIAGSGAITWSSTDPGVATVDATGLVRAVRRGGEALVRATAGEASGTVVVWVMDQIAFVRGDEFHYLINEDGSGEKHLASEVEYQPPAWSPDGSKLAYQRHMGVLSTSIWVMGADGTGDKRLTFDKRSDFPARSPDGSKIAFVTTRDNNSEIYVMNADGSEQTRLTTSPNFEDTPVWSPDGSKIAFLSYRDFDVELYVMDADGGNQTRLTESAGPDRDPSWSPDGSKIVFISERTGTPQVFVMNADGSGQVQISKNGANNYLPTWSPDGTRILYIGYGDIYGSIYVVNADGSNEVELTRDLDGDFIDPAWSPDGSLIILSGSIDDGAYELYLNSSPGGPLTMISSTPGVNKRLPVWRPRPR